MKVISALSLSLGLVFVACSQQESKSATKADKTEEELMIEMQKEEVPKEFGKDYRPLLHCFTDIGGPMGGHATLYLVGKLKKAVKGKKPELETLLHPEPPANDGLDRNIRGLKGTFGKKSWAGNTWTYQISNGTIKWNKGDGKNPDRPLKSITYDAVKKTIDLDIDVDGKQFINSHKNCILYMPEVLPAK